MAVYARGYRPYTGGFGGSPAGWTIFREGYMQAYRSGGFRFIALCFLVWFVIWAGVLYSTLGVVEGTREQGLVRPGQSEQMPLPTNFLNHTLGIFYGGVTLLSGLLAIMVGSGLLADDLRTRALPLYLVRPMGAADYVLGKALVLPVVLAWFCLLPGLLYYLLVGMWRPPGETGAFLTGNLDIVHRIVHQYLIAAGSYTGLMLFLSARTPRRGAVIGISAAILFLGSMLAGFSRHFSGALGTSLRYLGIPFSFEAAYAQAAAEASTMSQRRVERVREILPDPDVALWISLGLLLLGLWSVWRRARTVEVTG